MIKIGVIGAGGSFAVGLIHDLCLTPNLHGSRVSLMDTDPERLACAHSVLCRHAREMGVPLRIDATSDRRECLDGADFVINTALRDGARQLREGWAIARRHGARFGGSYHVLYDEPFWVNFHQFRLFESLTRDMLEICPEALHLLVANPVLAGTTLLGRTFPDAKVVGMCHGFAEVFRVGAALDIAPADLTFEIAGVNHFVWLTALRRRGEDMLPVLAGHAAAGDAVPGLNCKKLDVCRRLGAYPIGDTANWTGASWPWWYHAEPETEARWGENSEKPWYDYLDRLGSGGERLRGIAADTGRRVAEAYGLRDEPTGEPMIPLVESMACDVPRVIIANILNDGEYVAGLPRDFEVEIPALVSAEGIRGMRTRALPRPVLAWLLRDRVAPVELELEAYRTGSRDLLVQLVLTDRWIASEDAAKKLVDEILAVPCHRAMGEHYR